MFIINFKDSTKGNILDHFQVTFKIQTFSTFLNKIWFGNYFSFNKIGKNALVHVELNIYHKFIN